MHFAKNLFTVGTAVLLAGVVMQSVFFADGGKPAPQPPVAIADGGKPAPQPPAFYGIAA